MTVAEQQTLFEQTRGRIQRNLNEIAALAQRASDPREFFSRFLELAVDSLGAQGGCVWNFNAGGFERFSEIRFSSSEYESSALQRKAVDNVMAQVAQNRQQYIVAAGDFQEATNITPYPYFYTPVLLGERTAMILQVWLRDVGDPQGYRDIAAFLASLASHAVIFLRNHQGAVATARNEELSLLLDMQSSLLGELNPKEVSGILVNYTSDLIRADLACLFKRQGRRWRLAAASNQDAIDEKSQQSRRLIEWAGLLESGEKAQSGSVESCEDEKRRVVWESLGYEQAAWKTLRSPERHPDHLLCAFRHGAASFAPQVPEILDRLGEAAGKALDTAHHYHALPFRSVLGRIARTMHDWRSHRRHKFLVLIGVAVVVLAGLFAIPVPLKITADCSVEAAQKGAAVAEIQGKIVSVLVREGTRVEQGEVLARLGDEDYVTQLAVAEQQRVRWQVEAARAQSAGDEAERKLSEVNAQRETEVIKRLQYLRSKTEIRAPLPGIILTKNLHNREGEVLETGGVFCEISGEEGFNLVLQIKQNDIGDLMKALREKGALPVDFILHSHAKHHLATWIKGEESISQLPEIRKDHSCFLVKIPFPGDSSIDHMLKSGYTGKAKIRLGRSDLFYSWFRPFLNYWRVEWGV